MASKGFAPVMTRTSDLRPWKPGLEPHVARLLMRENHDLFAETSGGCALWKNRQAVETMLARR